MDPGVGGGVRVPGRGPRRPWPPLPDATRKPVVRPLGGPTGSRKSRLLSLLPGPHLPRAGTCRAPERATSTSGDTERFLVTEAAANRYSVFCFVWFPLLSKRKTQGNTIVYKASWGLRNEWGSFGESTSLIFQLKPSLGCV